MKKIISLILAVLMIATLGSVLVTAVAADEAAPVEEVYLYRNGVLCDLAPYSFADAQVLAGMDAFKVEGETSTYTIKLIKNVAATGSFVFSAPGVNVIIDGELEDGSKATLALTPASGGNANSLRFEGGAHYVLKSLNITGSNIGGCLIQVKTTAALDIVDTDITTTKEKYGTINMMRADGGIAALNIIRSTITQIESPISTSSGLDGQTGTADDFEYISQRAIIQTSNAGDFQHFVFNLIDSTLKSESCCFFINTNSTAEVTIKNSTLEVLAHEKGALVYTKNPNWTDNNINDRAAVAIDKLALKDTNPARDTSIPNTIVVNAENTLIKYPTTYAAKAIAMPEGDDAAGITVTYAPGEPNANVKTDVTGLGLLECPVVQLPTPEETTTAGETTTATPGGNTTTADPDTTTADPEEDDTTPPADDQTTAPADDQTTAPAGDDVTTAGDDAAAGGCAGCNDAGAGAAIALAVAMAAAVAIIIKKK